MPRYDKINYIISITVIDDLAYILLCALNNFSTQKSTYWISQRENNTIELSQRENKISLDVFLLIADYVALINSYDAIVFY